MWQTETIISYHCPYGNKNWQDINSPGCTLTQKVIWTFDQMVLLDYLTIWKIYISIFTRFMGNKLGSMLITGGGLVRKRFGCYLLLAFFIFFLPNVAFVRRGNSFVSSASYSFRHAWPRSWKFFIGHTIRLFCLCPESLCVSMACYVL